MPKRQFIPILILLTLGLVSGSKAQVENHILIFQKMEQKLFTEKYFTINLKTESNKNTIVYHYPKEKLKYEWFRTNRFLNKYKNDSLLGYIYLDTTKSETHPILGKIYPFSFSSLKDIEHKKDARKTQTKLDSISNNSGSPEYRIYTIETPQYLDAGASRWWSEKYGEIMLRAYMTLSGKVLFSVNGKVIPSKDRYELFFK